MCFFFSFLIQLLYLQYILLLKKMWHEYLFLQLPVKSLQTTLLYGNRNLPPLTPLFGIKLFFYFRFSPAYICLISKFNSLRDHVFNLKFLQLLFIFYRDFFSDFFSHILPTFAPLNVVERKKKIQRKNLMFSFKVPFLMYFLVEKFAACFNFFFSVILGESSNFFLNLIKMQHIFCCMFGFYYIAYFKGFYC